jgi:hypothetical protein
MSRDERVKALDKMSKATLVSEFVRVVGRPEWTAHPIERWHREELIDEILDVEYCRG